MKFFAQASIFSVVFAGVLAGALTTKPTAPIAGDHSVTVSSAMPVPTCPHVNCRVQ
jgi:hypothetical protein